MLPVEEEKREFKVDLRIEGIPPDAILEDQEKMTKIQKLVNKLRAGYHYQIDQCRFAEDGKIRQIHSSTTSLSTCTPVRPSLMSTSHGDLPCADPSNVSCGPSG